ncbi:MAG: flagellar basal body P-ring protein FlgI [Phycisphaeraceae bacterium]
MMTQCIPSRTRRENAGGSWLCGRFPHVAAAALSLSLALLMTGCGSDGPKRVNSPPPGQTFTGESYLHGTVGSMTSLRSFEPVLVSGYGIVVMPAGSGTGSSDVPAYLRTWMLNEMRKKGLGSAQFGTEELSPRRVLDSKDTALVYAEGLMPPGATAGTTFPILVTAVENTQTTSLENGSLWTVDLAIGPVDQSLQFRRPVAEARGAVFINPFDDKVTEKERLSFQRQAVVLAGGVVSKDRPIELNLNQPDYPKARMIADRINERYPHEKATEFFNTAVAKTDMLIRINVPARFATDPAKLMRLIGRTYIRRGDNYEQEQARRLGDYILLPRPDQARDVSEAWQAMGKLVLPVIREYYRHEKVHMRMASLEAGAWLQDEVAAAELQRLSLDLNVEARIKAAELLGRLPRSTRASRALQALADDPETRVRIAAYESLATMGDPSVHRTVVGDESSFKYFLDVVKSRNPLIYVSQRDVPRLVIFSSDTGFAEQARIALWDGRFRMLVGEADETVSVFYQGINDIKGQSAQIAPTVANLALIMGHRTTAERPFPGFDLSYGTVVNALFNLQKQKVVLSEMQVARNPLADAVDMFRKKGPPDVRPETGEDELPAAAGVVQPRQPQPVSIDPDGATPTDLRGGSQPNFDTSSLEDLPPRKR